METFPTNFQNWVWTRSPKAIQEPTKRRTWTRRRLTKKSDFPERGETSLANKSVRLEREQTTNRGEGPIRIPIMNESSNHNPSDNGSPPPATSAAPLSFWGVGALAGTAAAPSSQAAAASASRRLRRQQSREQRQQRQLSSTNDDDNDNHNLHPSHTTDAFLVAADTAATSHNNGGGGSSYLRSYGSSSAAASSSYDDEFMSGSGTATGSSHSGSSRSGSSHSGGSTTASSSASSSPSSSPLSGTTSRSTHSRSSYTTASTLTRHTAATPLLFGFGNGGVLAGTTTTGTEAGTDAVTGASSLESPRTHATTNAGDGDDDAPGMSTTFSTLSPNDDGPLSTTFTEDRTDDGGGEVLAELVPPSLAAKATRTAASAVDNNADTSAAPWLRPVRVTISSDAKDVLDNAHVAAKIGSPDKPAAATSPTTKGCAAAPVDDKDYAASTDPAPGSPPPFSVDKDDDDDLGTASSDTTQPTSPGRAAKARLEQDTSSPEGDRNPDNDGGSNVWVSLVPPQLTTAVSNDKQQQPMAVSRPAELLLPHDPSGASSFLRETSSSASNSPNRRQRVPGGAAAKLLLRGPRDDDASKGALDPTTTVLESQLLRSGLAVDVAGTGDSEETFEESLKEIEITLKLAKQEFELGSPSNRRYHGHGTADDADGDADDEDDDAPHESGSYTPSFLNRSEVFFASASAAIAALLTPRAAEASATLSASFSSHGSNQGVFFRSATGTQSGEHVLGPSPSSASSSAFHTPDVSMTSAVPPPRPDAASYLSFGRRDVSGTLLPPGTDKKIEELDRRMHNPTKTLTDLLTAIATPEQSHMMDLGFMVRRKNACGALKILAGDPKKRSRIAWTVGVLPALASVLADAAELGVSESFPDPRIRDEYEAARNRAIAALLHLSIPKANRIPVFHTPRLVQSLLAIIADDSGEARRGCTAILAYLAKTVENRLLMVQVPGFSAGVVAVLRPLVTARESEGAEPRPKAKARYPWSSESDTESEVTGRPRSNEDEDSDRTPIVMPSRSPTEALGYDESADVLLRASRQNVFAVLKHVGKEKDNAYHLARDPNLLHTLIAVSGCQKSPSHDLAVQFLANLTRHRLNTKLLVFNERRAVPALVKAANSSSDQARLYACYAIQNMAQDKACRQELAAIDGLVSTLCSRGRYAAAEPERLSAISALKNLCDEPANLIPLTNTPACVATLMHLAHGKEEGVTEMMQYRACDALATLSHWLRKIATSGKSLDALQRGQPSDTALFVPSLRVVTWNQWE